MNFKCLYYKVQRRILMIYISLWRVIEKKNSSTKKECDIFVTESQNLKVIFHYFCRKI